jgi:DNA-binding NarL/FixJ family response regulator
VCPPPQKLSILLVDHQQLVLEALTSVLEAAGYLVIARCADAAEAREACVTLRPDVVLMELELPGGPELDLIGYLQARCPRTRIVALTGCSSGQAIFAAILAGVHGYVFKTDPLCHLHATLEDMREGRSLLDPAAREIAARWSRPVADALAQTAGSPRWDLLSHRERDVAALVATGMTNDQIAAALVLSRHTVRHHLERIKDKLDAHSRAEVALATPIGSRLHLERGANGTFVPISLPRAP